MPGMTDGHDDAVNRIYVQLEANKANSQGVDNNRLLAEAIVDAIEKDLMPKALVTGTTTTFIGTQPLIDGKVN